MGAVAGDGSNVELVVAPLLAVEDAQGAQLGEAVLLEDNLEGRVAVMLVRDAEGTDLGAEGADLGGDLDQGLVLLDKAMIARL